MKGLNKYFAVFKSGHREVTGDGLIPVDEYFVIIEADSGLEAIRLFTVNFGASFERIFTQEQFTPEVEAFYPKGAFATLSPNAGEYFVLSPDAFTYALDHDFAVSPTWKDQVLFSGPPEDCCNIINENTTFDIMNPDDMGLCLVSDGKRVLIEWLRPTGTFGKAAWIPQKF